MLRCAIRGAHGLYALYRKADLRCWLPALRSPLFICHFRYNARRHAAGTSMYAQVRHPWRTWPVRVIPKGRFTLLASCSSQSFVYLALSIQRSQARSKYFHVCSAAPSVAHMACTRYTERRTCGAGFLLFAVLCLSGTFDTTLAGTQQVLPCMFSCAILGAQGQYALYRKADLRCWLPALRSPLFIWHFRYNARRHAAGTSMYAQVRHPWRTWPVRVIPKGRFTLLASCSSQSFVYLALSIQRSQARSKYFHVCSAAPSVAHMACTRYRKANLRCLLPALRSPLFIWHFRYNARRHAASTSMYVQLRHPWRTRPVRVIPKGRFTLLASCSSQPFVYLALSIQRSQARSRYIHVCSGAPSVAHMACTRYTERPIYAAGFLLFAVLCLSGTFDTTLAGTQQVLPCMFSCAIRGAHGLYALPKGQLAVLASCSSQSFVYLALSIQRSQARSKYFHVCSAAP